MILSHNSFSAPRYKSTAVFSFQRLQYEPSFVLWSPMYDRLIFLTLSLLNDLSDLYGFRPSTHRLDSKNIML